MESTNNLLTGLMRLKSAVRTAKSIFVLSLALALLTFTASFITIMFVVSNEVELNSTASFYKAKYSDPKRIIQLATEEGNRAVYAEDIISNDWVENNISEFKNSVFLSIAVSLILSVGAVFGFVFLSSRLGKDRFVRGGQKKESIALDDEEVAFSMGEVGVRHRAARAGVAIIGDSGVGKSQAIMKVIKQFLDRDEKALIYDRTGDLTEAFYREGRDIILNPFDSRMPYWSIFNELETEYDPERLARSFCPSSPEGKKNSNTKYWEDTPMQVLADLLRKLAQKGECSHSKLLELLLPTNLELLNELLEGCQSQSAISPENEKVALSVLSTLSSKLGALAYIEAEERAGFSLRKWASDPTDDRRVFLTINKNQQEISNSIITFWADTILAEVLSLKKENRVNPSWYIFDEFQSLERMQSITDALNEIRKMNGRVLLSVTSLPILKSIYGEEGTSAILSTCGVKMIFQNGDPKSAVYLSDLLSKREFYSGRVQMREKGQSDVGDNKEESALFSSSEIQNLGDLKLIIKQSGLPLVSTKINYQDYPSIATAMVERASVGIFPKTDTVNVPQAHFSEESESYSLDDFQFTPEVNNEQYEEERAPAKVRRKLTKPNKSGKGKESQGQLKI